MPITAAGGSSDLRKRIFNFAPAGHIERRGRRDNLSERNNWDFRGDALRQSFGVYHGAPVLRQLGVIALVGIDTLMHYVG
jgi:hypothetical protein